MSEMTDAAVLIFKLAVPVASGLKREGQYERGHHDGHDPIGYSPVLGQPHTPTEMLLRRSLGRNREYYFCDRLAIRAAHLIWAGPSWQISNSHSFAKLLDSREISGEGLTIG
jgi:hypothetical protein